MFIQNMLSLFSGRPVNVSCNPQFSWPGVTAQCSFRILFLSATPHHPRSVDELMRFGIVIA